MTSPALPDHWPNLSGLDLSDTRSADSRSALLTVNAEMFVAAPARDRDIIETFETLALGFLPRADHATLIALARILAPCPDTPASILDHLVRHSAETRDIVLGEGSHLPPGLVPKLLGTAEGRLRLAFHPALDIATIDNLLVTHESAVEDALAVNKCLVPSGRAFRELVQRARHRLPLAALLLARENVSLADETALYLAADAERRRQIRQRLAASDGVLRPQLFFALTDYERAALFAAAQASDVRHFEALLSFAFGFPAALEWRILAAGRHDLLALALQAIGLSRREAIQIFLSLHPALSHGLSQVTKLAREKQASPRPVALALVEAILGIPARSS